MLSMSAWCLLQLGMVSFVIFLSFGDIHNKFSMLDSMKWLMIPNMHYLLHERDKVDSEYLSLQVLKDIWASIEKKLFSHH